MFSGSIMSESTTVTLNLLAIVGILFGGGMFTGANMNCEMAADFSGIFGRTPTCKVVEAELRKSLSRPVAPPPPQRISPPTEAKTTPRSKVTARVAGKPIEKGLSQIAVSQASADLAFAFQRGGLPAMAALTEACYRDNIEFPESSSPVTQTRCLLLDYGAVKFQELFLPIAENLGEDPKLLDGGAFLEPEKVEMRRKETARVLFDGDQEGQQILMNAILPAIVKGAMNSPIDTAMSIGKGRQPPKAEKVPELST
jgi:hypothetical protein